ncbi:MAG: XdhC family protein [Firmicutes bacterium]|nr:XdhC family protein [Bacillota bacterium]
MRNQFQQVLAQTKAGNTAKIEFQIEGKTYTRLFRPKERLIILGGGHIAFCLYTMAVMVGFDIIVVDDRPEFANADRFPRASRVICGEFAAAIGTLPVGPGDYVVIATRSHTCDPVCLHAVLDEHLPYYIGLLGSRKRTALLLAQLAEEGIPQERLDMIHTPIGLSINALTAEEIAVSIMAELIRERRKNVKRNSRSTVFVEETFPEEVVQTIAQESGAQVLLLVYETVGSTPVKSGSVMTVDAGGRCIGSIGGGLAEYIAVKNAKEILGSGQTRTLAVDLSQDTEEAEGMVCGGTMKILLMCL